MTGIAFPPAGATRASGPAAPGDPTIVIDVRGMNCPGPIISLRRAMSNLQPGDTALLMATDKGSKTDVPAWIEETGHELVDLTEAAGVFRFTVRKPQPAFSMSLDLPSTGMAGSMLGPYRLDRLLGKGNRATLYRAHRLDDGLPVALRIFDRELIEDAVVKVSLSESMNKAASLRHPFVVSPDAWGEDDGKIFVARPYISGDTARRRFGAPLKVSEALAILKPIAGALDYVHAHGLVHGDLKPGNILIPTNERVLLVELGLGPLVARANGMLMLNRGTHFGTPEYMAPEQRWGTSPTERSDLYAFAVMLYEALAGRPPFRAEHPDDTPRLIMHRHLTMQAPPLKGLNSSVTTGIDAVMARALAKDPKDRYHACADLVAALERAA